MVVTVSFSLYSVNKLVCNGKVDPTVDLHKSCSEVEV